LTGRTCERNRCSRSSIGKSIVGLTRKREAESSNRPNQIELISISSSNHLPGTDEPKTWEPNPFAATHGEQCCAIEGRPESDNCADIAKNAKHTLPRFSPRWSTSEVSMGQPVDMRVPDGAVDCDQRYIRTGLLTTFKARRRDRADAGRPT
jgi:hypothetical protein